MINPPDASINVQNALGDLDGRLLKLEGKLAALKVLTSSDLDSALASLKKQIADAAQSGPDDADRLFTTAPRILDPLSQNALKEERFLALNGRWMTLLDGLLQRVTFDGDPSDSFNLLGNLMLIGALSCGDVLCNDLRVFGTLTQSGTSALASVGYSCSGANATLNTLIFTDDAVLYTLVSGKIQVNLPGLYLAVAQVQNSGLGSGAAITSSVTKNGATIQPAFTGAANSSGTFVPTFPVVAQLVAGDQLGLFNPGAAGSILLVTRLHG